MYINPTIVSSAWKFVSPENRDHTEAVPRAVSIKIFTVSCKSDAAFGLHFLSSFTSFAIAPFLVSSLTSLTSFAIDSSPPRILTKSSLTWGFALGKHGRVSNGIFGSVKRPLTWETSKKNERGRNQITFLFIFQKNIRFAEKKTPTIKHFNKLIGALPSDWAATGWVAANLPTGEKLMI